MSKNEKSVDIFSMLENALSEVISGLDKNACDKTTCEKKKCNCNNHEDNNDDRDITLSDMLNDKDIDKVRFENLSDMVSNALQHLCDQLPNLYGAKTVKEVKPTDAPVENKDKKDNTPEDKACIYGGSCNSDCIFSGNDCESIADIIKPDKNEITNEKSTKNTAEFKKQMPNKKHNMDFDKLSKAFSNENRVKEFEKAIDDYIDEVKNKENKEAIKPLDTNNEYLNIGNTIRSITSDPINYTAVYIQYKLKQLFSDFVIDNLKDNYRLFPVKEYSIKNNKQIWCVEIPMDYCIHECIYNFDQDKFDSQMEKFFVQYGFHMFDWVSNYHNIKFYLIF